MRVMVLGAGVVGVTAAWYLLQDGHQVTVVDRQPAAGLETSFANGGQISVSHAEPWANPQAPLKILQWLGREDAPLLFRLRCDPAQWRWGLSFLRECTRARTRYNVAQLVALGLYSRQCLQQLRRATGIDYDHLERGILHFWCQQQAFDAAHDSAQVMREHGCDVRILNPDEVIAIEPALRHARAKIVGGSYTVSDESGDAHRFTQQLAALAQRQGARFLYGLSLQRLEHAGGQIIAVHAQDTQGQAAVLQADAYVCAMGPYSAAMLAPLGLRLNIYPAKGYSATLPIADAGLACTASLTDEEHKIVYTRLGNRLRVAGTAELNGYNLQLNPVRCQALVKRLLEIFPGVAQASQAQYWSGLRPATPSNRPYIGRTRYRNLYLNTGHGTLGWTHACGSGQSLADIVAGRQPAVDFAFSA